MIILLFFRNKTKTKLQVEEKERSTLNMIIRTTEGTKCS